jgi:hypothetical protein
MVTLSDKSESAFHQKVAGCCHTAVDNTMADRAEKYLQEWGVDASQLEPLVVSGNNALVFKAGALVVKVVTELENPKGTEAANNPLVLKPLRSRHLGFDMGGAAISLEVAPLLNTKDVEPRHVAALCGELYSRYGLLFRDNKLENVGLTQAGLPYVIDPGAVIPASSLSALEQPFFYPEHSKKTADGSFSWPKEQQEEPTIASAAAQLVQPRPLLALALRPSGWKAGL